MKHPRESTQAAMHAEIGHILFGIRDATDALIAIRQKEHGQLLDGEREELEAIKENLDWLLNDIQASRVAA